MHCLHLPQFVRTNRHTVCYWTFLILSKTITVKATCWCFYSLPHSVYSHTLKGLGLPRASRFRDSHCSCICCILICNFLFQSVELGLGSSGSVAQQRLVKSKILIIIFRLCLMQLIISFKYRNAAYLFTFRYNHNVIATRCLFICRHCKKCIRMINFCSSLCRCWLKFIKPSLWIIFLKPIAMTQSQQYSLLYGSRRVLGAQTWEMVFNICDRNWFLIQILYVAALCAFYQWYVIHIAGSMSICTHILSVNKTCSAF